VIWESYTQDGSQFGIFGQRDDATGAPLGSEFRVNTYTTDRQDIPALAMDAAGNFVVVWTSDGQDGSSEGIFGQRYDATGTPRGAEFQINTFTTGQQQGAAVAVDAVGNFVVVWYSQEEASGVGVFGQRYDATGARLGSAFHVNTYTTDHQGHPAVAMDAVGNFVVVWESSTQDGSFDGVFGQRYDATGGALRRRIPRQHVHDGLPE
jgi:hypothetical protein